MEGNMDQEALIRSQDGVLGCKFKPWFQCWCQFTTKVAQILVPGMEANKLNNEQVDKTERKIPVVTILFGLAYQGKDIVFGFIIVVYKVVA